MTIDFLCVGHAAYDISMFVDEYPKENSKCETDLLLEMCGGPAANAACLLSQWGGRCAFAGLVGDDLYGQRIRDDLRLVGTDVSLLELRPGHVTPVSMILINRRNGSRTIVNRTRRDATLQLTAKQIAGLSPKVVLFDGHQLEASLAALNAFPEAVSILDAGSWREGTSSLAGKVDYLAASERFALQATGLADLRSLRHRQSCLQQLRTRFATKVIVTLGESGLITDDGSGFRHLAAFPAETIDSTAAGDIFHGALAFGIGRSMPLWETLRFASMAAALSVRLRGGRSSIPSLQCVNDMLAQASSDRT